MDNSSEPIMLPSSRTPSNKPDSGSERKLVANRENALKSTGPRTERGKGFSRKNAWKHGLFARQFMDFQAHGENPEEYGELLHGLWEQFQPIGSAEELEVQRIAQCWWRLKRAYRYENAMNRVAQRDFARRELEKQVEYCRKLEGQEKAAAQLLQNAEHEIWAAGKIPQHLKDRVSEVMPGAEVLWPGFERVAEQGIDDAVHSKLVPEPNSKSYGPILATVTAGLAVRCMEDLGETRSASVYEIAIAQHVIPNRDALDKILRYETSIERSLDRSLERLERMQRSRRVENDTHRQRSNL